MPKPIHGPVIPTRGVRKVQEPDEEGFDSYCTICDHLIPLASLSQLYCSERCRKTDTASHPLSSTNPHSLSSSPTTNSFTPHEWPEPPPSIIVPPAVPTLLSDHRPSFSSPALSGRIPLTPASAPMSRQNSANGTSSAPLTFTTTTSATTGGLPTIGSLAARPPMLMHTKTAPAAPQLNSIQSYSYSSSPAAAAALSSSMGGMHPALRPLPPLHAMSSSPRSLDLVVPLSSPRNSGTGTATAGVGSIGTGFGEKVGGRSRSNSTLNPNPALNPPATTSVGTNGPDTDLYFGKMYRTPSSSSSHSAGGAGLKKLFYFKEVQRVPSELTLANAGRSAPVGEGEGVLSPEGEVIGVDGMFGEMEEGERMEWPR
ncbi:hypothetical protein SAICODRAFT_29952 [Saitoella complicata NRRL Y-17804]|uniref:Life-span regulatory factor-domain-containing protein n=1 Tax=Saitoella complicata (strain BCRC 22490 / CBS 7301 / JCM 7358 / NBRC 10748 / NRRL Y-17804) TaxID=698492 RepID=A0A0E9NFZ2_SAICN|nr:uncharacterized protein SAICODRAFT_29952 [Saitoella complicata NRRL Y-17804]ODQ53553.1 hypothetical protein SAICODRAFT_29952 [Saitoella complicata NRRL Y-17804]GAO48733.1 hypothetical protein G7K_2903-t1 [Saitoella complicata NRRL Y-17804]